VKPYVDNWKDFHTAATLALKAGEGIHVVSRRLGHRKIEITLNTYAHLLPSMGKEAAARMSSVLGLPSVLKSVRA
jgi:integrase